MMLLDAILFLTILPFPTKREVTEAHLTRATACFPLVGMLLGGALLLSARLAASLWSPPTVNALVLILWGLLTGGLHLDGLADTVDGLCGGATREEKLAIMRDSRVGVFGAATLFGLLLLKLSLLGELGGAAYGDVLVLAPTLGRWAMVCAIFFFPPARAGGMGHLFKKHCGWQGLAFATATALSCAILLLGPWGSAVFGGLGLAVAMMAWALTRALGGLTGDTYGALCEVGEVLTLVIISLLAKGGLV
jgi:adenosylcobinamide-GDP ribazoletransferase